MPPRRFHGAVTQLAAQGPLIIAIDDVHRSDVHSLHCLDFSLRRSSDLPLMVVLTQPSESAAFEPRTLTRLLAQRHWELIELAPLTPREVAEVVERRLGRTPEPDFLRQCSQSSRGVPALLHQLLDELGGDPEGAVGAARTTSRRLTGQALADDLLRLPYPVPPLLVAMAVLGVTDAQLLGELTHIPVPTVRRVVSGLNERQILVPDGSRFASESLRECLLRSVEQQELHTLGVRGARLLEDAGRPPGEVADVLLGLHTPAEPWMLEVLNRAARCAQDSGRPDSAVRYLTHALAVGADSDPGSVRAIRVRLTEVLSATDPCAALPHLDILLTSSEDSEDLAATTMRYANTLVLLGHNGRAARLLAEVLGRPRLPRQGVVGIEDEHRPMLESALLMSGVVEHSSAGWVRERGDALPHPRSPEQAEDDSPGGRRLRLTQAVLSVLGGNSATTVREQMRTALTGPRTPLDDMSLIASAMVLHLTDDNEASLGILVQIVREAGPTESTSETAALMTRAAVRFGTGDLPTAEADARRAVLLSSERPGGQENTAALTVLSGILVMRDLDATEAVLAEVTHPEAERSSWEYPSFLWIRAALQRERGLLDAALLSLRACGRMLRLNGTENPVLMPWWVDAADLLVTLGRTGEAQEVADHGEALAKNWGTSRSTGLVLLARGLAAGGRRGRELLAEACAVLADSPARVLHARAEFALGAALLEAGDQRAARIRLRAALDLMIRCGAEVPAQRAHELMSAAGGRPRPMSGHPADALTASERRVAALAAAGSSNAEIAETLFITRRTVELHLTHVYRKLGVSRRGDLTEVLAEGGEGVPSPNQ
jgi:DNA-binding CsgD family transcriptional regulator